MKAAGILTFVALFSLLVAPFSGTAADSVLEGKESVIGVIIELAPDGSYVQVADFGINRIDEIVLTSEQNATSVGTPADLALGSVVEASLDDLDSEGLWRASRIVVLAGEGLKAAIADLSGDEQGTLAQSRTNLGTGGESLAVPASSSEKPTPTGQDGLRLEDGVWRN